MTVAPGGTRDPERGAAAEGRLRGVIPVLETPFTDTGAVDFESFGRVVDHVIGTGVAGLMFPGFASEFHKLSESERWQLVDMLLERTRSRPDIAAVISVPDHATYLAVQAVERAARGGADAINILPPYFLRPAAAEVRRHLESVVGAAMPLPVIIQLAPDLTGAGVTLETLTRLREAAPNFNVVKVETNPPGPMVSALAALDPPLDTLVGYAGMHMIDAAARGASGVQPGCSFAEVYVAIWNAWIAGERGRAADMYQRLLPFVSYWMQEAELIVQVEKVISLRRGLLSSDHCRRPHRSLDRPELEGINRFLAEFAAELAPIR